MGHIDQQRAPRPARVAGKSGACRRLRQADRWSARRGTYRILYRIVEAKREVVVLRIEHRRDAYRT